MNNKNKTRTNQDLLFAIMREIGGPLMVECFKQQVLPHIRRTPGSDQQLTEQEYQQKLAQIRTELPAFRQFLLQRDLGELPTYWNASQN